MAVMPIVGRRCWRLWIGRLWWGRRIWQLVRIRGIRVWCGRYGVLAAWRLGRRGWRIVLAWEFGRCGCGIFVTRKLRWGGSRAGIRVIVAGQLRRRGFRRDREPIGDEILRIDEPVIAVCIGRTSGGRRSVTVAAGARKKKRAVRCETVGAVEPGTETVLMIVATVALRKEAVLDAVDCVGAREHVTVGRIEVVGEAVDVMVPAGFQKWG